MTPIAPGEIGSDAGGDKLRGELLNAKGVRCGDLWQATASTYADGAAEIEVAAAYDAASDSWRLHEYFFSFEATITALVALEATGELHGEDAQEA